MKVNVYVDGFNLYYRALKKPRDGNGNSYKWLDVSALCARLLTTHSINRIRYFTARVKPRSGNPDVHLRQQAYLRALKTIPNLTIHEGHFIYNKGMAKLVRPLADGTKFVEVHKSEEKGSDANLAAYLLLDGFRNDYEGAAVITNDSDLAEPIRLVRDELQLKAMVLDPCPDRVSHKLSKSATFYRSIREATIAASQFAATLTDAKGPITKPTRW